ncbi:MAG: bifunctional UDP-N-acetylglucosamine diphosphorylase/glucosamine-1-phosphate N-acetyltransferase GlmU [Bacteriovoracales bacterium]|nr:bifunctional UDP-N-acetylglucosamine diphosphorylase/glucosamine-1-phosphate N-acetyltransferase GlmU [Bacteriovoracales bacterium]
MKKTMGIVVLAAGEGKRFKAPTPKPLAPLCGRRMVDFPLSESLSFAEKASLQTFCTVVTGHERERVEAYLRERYNKQINFTFQKEQKGTADALKSYFESHGSGQKTDLTLVLCADTPLIRRRHLSALYQALADGDHDGVVAAFRTSNPQGYGRITSGQGPGFSIVEEDEASDEIRKITLVNSGLYLFKTSFLLEHLEEIGSGAKDEFYLTKIFQDHLKLKAVLFPDAHSFMGVNTLRQLGAASHEIRREINQRHLENGVLIVDERHTSIDWEVSIGENSVIHPHNFIYGRTKIGRSVHIGPNCTIEECDIRDHASIKGHCHLEKASIAPGAAIGPFAHLRPESHIGEGSKIGNFVEIKKAVLHRGVKVSHLSYVGDAEIGEESNIGCGFITCNYDGTLKHKTTIGKRAFIGSDTQTVAPVSIGDDAYIASGSTINRDVPKEAFAVARSRQVTKEGMAKRFKKKKTEDV